MTYEFYNEDCIAGAREHIGDGEVDLMITDPPFGIHGDKISRMYARKSEFVTKGYIEVAKENYLEFSNNWVREAERILRPGGQIYVVSGYTNLPEVLMALRGAGLKEVNHLIWKYNFGPYTKNKFVSSHYHVLLYEKKGKGKRTFNRNCRYTESKANYRDREDVWQILKEYHPGRIKNVNKLPEELVRKMLQYSSQPGDLVCDFFLGNFTVPTVCKKVGIENFTGFEISKEIFDAGHRTQHDIFEPRIGQDLV